MAVAGDGGGHSLDQTSRVGVEHRLVEACLRAEVVVEDRLCDPGLAPDLRDRRPVETACAEDRATGVEDLVPPGLVGADVGAPRHANRAYSTDRSKYLVPYRPIGRIGRSRWRSCRGAVSC